MGCRIFEVGISYYGRGYSEGKKIGLRDALWAMVCIARYGLVSRLIKSVTQPKSHANDDTGSDRSH